MKPTQHSKQSLLVDYHGQRIEQRGLRIFYAEVSLSEFIIAKGQDLESPLIFLETERQQILEDFMRRTWNSFNKDLFGFMLDTEQMEAESFISGNFNQFMPLGVFEFRSLLDLSRVDPVATKLILEKKSAKFKLDPGNNPEILVE